MQFEIDWAVFLDSLISGLVLVLIRNAEVFDVLPLLFQIEHSTSLIHAKIQHDMAVTVTLLVLFQLFVDLRHNLVTVFDCCFNYCL